MTVDEYMEQVPEEQSKYFKKLRESIIKRLPKGFQETINYRMLGYVVPHALYTTGYHCNPDEPLPFINIAANKKTITLYHMGIYGNAESKKMVP